VIHHPNRSVLSRRASCKFIPDARHEAQHLAGCHLAAPLQATTPPLPRLSALGCLTSFACAGPTMPSADFCGAVREDSSALSPQPGHTADLPRSAVIPSVHRRRIYKARPSCGWRALLSRASSPRAYHTSYPVRVPRPARAFHAAFSPHLAVTPWRFPCPSAPRIPGQGTCTPKHDSMHGTHAQHQRRRGAPSAGCCC
jgi:hypothetical protein